jgi:hypothetical protein
MPEAVAIPYGPWSGATHCKVVVTTKPQPNVFPDVEIYQVPFGGGSIWVTDLVSPKGFPKGVLVLNDNPRQVTDDPISTHGIDRFKINPPAQSPEQVPIWYNSGWPAGTIVLWDHLIPVTE